MACNQGVWNLGWPHHWRKRVSFSQTTTSVDPDTWAGPLFREYVHCEKHDQCEACGATRRHRSCMCDAKHAETCAIYLQWRNHTP